MSSARRPAETLWNWITVACTLHDLRVLYLWRALILALEAAKGTAMEWQPLHLITKEVGPTASLSWRLIARFLLKFSKPSSVIAVMVIHTDFVGTFIVGPLVYSFVWGSHIERVHVWAVVTTLVLIMMNLYEGYIFAFEKNPLHDLMRLEWVNMLLSVANKSIVFAYYNPRHQPRGRPRDQESVSLGFFSICTMIFFLEFVLMCYGAYNQNHPNFLQGLKDRYEDCWEDILKASLSQLAAAFGGIAALWNLYRHRRELRTIEIPSKTSGDSGGLLTVLHGWFKTDGFGWCCGITALVGAVTSSVPVMAVMVHTAYLKQDIQHYSYAVVTFFFAAYAGTASVAGLLLIFRTSDTIRAGLPLWMIAFAAVAMALDNPNPHERANEVRNILMLVPIGYCYGWVPLSCRLFFVDQAKEDKYGSARLVDYTERSLRSILLHGVVLMNETQSTMNFIYLIPCFILAFLVFLPMVVTDWKAGLSKERSGIETLRQCYVILMESLAEIKDEIQYQSRLTRTILLRANLEISEATFPTSFIILKEQIRKEDKSDEYCDQIVNTVMDYAEGLSRIMVDEDVSKMTNKDEIFKHLGRKLGTIFLWKKNTRMWLYAVDEASFEPVLDGMFPVEIKEPNKFVPKLLPLMQTTLYLAAIYGSAASVMRLFGYPLPVVSKEAIEMGRDSVKLLQKESTVAQYDSLQKAYEDAKQVANISHSQTHTTVRGYTRDELESFYKNLKEPLLHEDGQRVKGAFGKLEKLYTADGKIIWTAKKKVLDDEGIITTTSDPKRHQK